MTYATNGNNSSNLDFFKDFANPGVKIKIQDKDANGAVVYEGIFTGQPFTYTPTASHIYFITTTNACGITYTYTRRMDGNDGHAEFEIFMPRVASTGCGAAERMSIDVQFGSFPFWKYPVTVEFKDNQGTVLKTETISDNSKTANANDLPMGTYTVTVTDGCGTSVTKTVQSPATAGEPSVRVLETSRWRCPTELPTLTQSGTAQVLLAIDGYVPDRENMVITITAGTSNVGVAGKLVSGQYYGWSNMLPGAYTVEFSSCGVTYTKTFTVPSDNVLKQNLVSVGKSKCSGGGDIISSSYTTHNIGYVYTIELLNANTNTVLQSNLQGDFTNLPAGKYKTRFKITPYCGTQYTYYVDGSEVTLSDQISGPKITYSEGVVCEDANGDPISTGSVYLNLSGVAPIEVAYKESDATDWIIASSAAGANLKIDGLAAYKTYNVRISDGCGSSTNANVLIRTIGAITSENTVQPCYDQSYVLSVPYYAGASYRWKNEAGAIVSSARNYSIPNFNESYNGTYTAEISWGTCVSRYVKVTLNGNLCAQPLDDYIIAVDDINQVPKGVAAYGNVMTNDSYVATISVQSARTTMLTA